MTSADLSAVELLAAYRTGELSPVEATHDALARIETYDPVVNAFCLVQADEAQAAAKESEARWHRGEPRGSLDGVPTSIKDLLLTAGRPTLRGSRTIDPAGPWEVDAPAVARLREHNAVIIGRTTTPELGWKGVTDSPLSGVTRNPWDPSTTAGGSSGGSAAAVALGMGALSLGTDGGGSVRIPAAFTGTSTIKPTYGRVPNWPASPYGTLAHVGPMTRSAADTALLLDAISGFDPRDPWALAPAAPTNGRLGETATAGMRIAVSPTLGYVRLDPEVAAAFESAVDVFASLGALLTEADPGFTDPVEAFHTLWFSGAAKSIEHLGPEQRALMDPALVAVAEEGARASALDYLTAMAVRNDLGRTMGEFHTRHALLLTPTMPIPAFEAGVESPAGWGERWTSWTPFTYPFNMTQQPAASVPCGFTRGGLPIGLQIVGPRHADRAVLSAAHAFQAVTDWHLQRPRPATG